MHTNDPDQVATDKITIHSESPFQRMPSTTQMALCGACQVAGGSHPERGVRWRMTQIGYRGFRFPPDVIQRAVWLYLRFGLSLRDVEDILAERGIEVTYETIRCWVDRFGSQIANRIRSGRPRPTSKWHLDEMFVSIGGRQMYLWRAIDDEGEVLEVLVTARRDKQAAIRLLRKLLKKYQQAPITIVTDRCRAFGAAIRSSNHAPTMSWTRKRIT